MKAFMIKYLPRLVGILGLSLLIGLASGCYVNLPPAADTLFTGVVTDSLENPLPDFTVRLEGTAKGGLFTTSKIPELIQSYELKTDQLGAFFQLLSWRDNIDSYSILPPFPNQVYQQIGGFYECPSPLEANCQLARPTNPLSYTVSVTLRVKFY